MPGAYDRSPWEKQPPTTPLRPKVKSKLSLSQAQQEHVYELYKSKKPLPSTIFDENVPATFWPILYGDNNRGWLLDDVSFITMSTNNYNYYLILILAYIVVF